MGVFLLAVEWILLMAYVCVQARALGKQNFSLKMKKIPLVSLTLPTYLPTYLPIPLYTEQVP
jgi:hypothetical protein